MFAEPVSRGQEDRYENLSQQNEGRNAQYPRCCDVFIAPCLICPAFAGDSLAGAVFVGSWRIKAIATAAAFDSTQTHFEFLDDGRVSSTVGCNRILGKPVIDGERIALGPMAATRRACLGPVGELETKYLAALDASGAPPVTLASIR